MFRTLRETFGAFRGVYLGKSAPSKLTPKQLALFRMALSIVVLAVSVALIFWNKGNSESIGAGMMGTVVGYWLN